MKEGTPKKEAEQSETEIVSGWIAELDEKIGQAEANLKFASRQKGSKTESLRAISGELEALKLTRKEYEELLESARKSKP
jgi:hypothetical protein